MSVSNVEPGIKSTESNFSIQLPDVSETLDQDREWCWVKHKGEKRKIRFHDYHELYCVEGLYEEVFYTQLRCNSPYTVCSLLKKELNKQRISPRSLSALDVGAGNGIVGEELVKLGVNNIIGIDIIQAAADAVQRDRPDIYQRYFVEDLTNLSPRAREYLEKAPLNCLTTVAALGFGDIPPLAFAVVFNLIAKPGWIAFNIKDRFISKKDSSGFSLLIQKLIDNKMIEEKNSLRYRHRLAIDGTPLYYSAILAKKLDNIPEAWMQELIKEHREMMS